MTNPNSRLPAALIVGLMALAAGIGAVSASSADAPGTAAPTGIQDSDEPVRCGFQVVSAGGATAIEAIVAADLAVTGSYQLRVTGSGGGGRTNISQGGPFAAGPDAEVTLGRVMLGNRGASYDAVLSISANGRTVECAGRIPAQA